MGQVLGRVTGRGLDGPRGPDVTHRIKVPRAWLANGSVIEIELPRHLCCAACEGGGCDTCERSGALTLRGRRDPAEIVEVTLPRTRDDDAADSRPFFIRIPEQGGLPPAGEDLPRGLLLLGIEASERADASVRLVHGPLARRDPEAPVVPSPRVPARVNRRSLALAALLVVLWVLLLLWLRLTGRA